ncbi:MAG TPA: ABC transporter ATP-binding protein [Clostridiaceae bacterium]|nr:ABC transporter ATP-binding protein [Clostridiaceae bacterium]
MENVIEMLHITKEFPGIIANDNVTLKLRQGEIHALLGENGAGKSTLMSVLFGLYKPEQGKILVNGSEVQIRNPNDATKYGIGMVHQHFKLVDNFTVLQNVVLGVETTKHGFLSLDAARQKVLELSERYQFNIDPDALIQDISVGMQQRVEIIKMLYRDNDILIFDEPTAVLTPQEIEELMEIMRQLIAEGKSIIFITHKLKEIKMVADRCTILRKGKHVATVDVADTSIEEMSELMVGRKVDLTFDLGEPKLGETVLKVRNLSMHRRGHGHQALDNVSFDLREGEVLCIGGIDGNGQSELVYAITGLIRDYEGQITLNGIDITNSSIRFRNTKGISHIPADRHKHGLVLDYTLGQNLVLQSYFEPELQKGGFINFVKSAHYAERLIEQYDIRSGQGRATLVRSMSGGNQQKAIVAREMERKHNVLIAVQPTRGLDVGAVEYIHRQILKHREEGYAVLLVSLELSEVLGISDRILVMYNGRLVGELKPRETTEKELGLYMSGAKSEEVVVHE